MAILRSVHAMNQAAKSAGSEEKVFCKPCPFKGLAEWLRCVSESHPAWRRLSGLLDNLVLGPGCPWESTMTYSHQVQQLETSLKPSADSRSSSRTRGCPPPLLTTDLGEGTGTLGKEGQRKTNRCSSLCPRWRQWHLQDTHTSSTLKTNK